MSCGQDADVTLTNEKADRMLAAFANAFKTPDLRRKILFTLFILAIFRLGSVIPTPNVNLQNVNECRIQAASGDAAGLYSMINLFSGGALLQLAIFALGIMPYITASIILQLLTAVIPRLETLKKEGGSGQQKITQYTRYLTLVLAVLQATAFVTLATSGQLFQGCSLPLVYDTSIFPIVTMILIMTAGTGLIMWMGELLTERGVGNGMSVMIFTQIAAQFPTQVWGIKQSRGDEASGWFALLAVIGVGLLVMLGVIFVEQAQRRIPVQYAKRMVGRRLVGGTTTYIPLKVNQAGVIPVIFASSMLYLPVLYAQFQPDNVVSNWIATNLITGQSFWYNAIFFLLIIFFTYFYVHALGQARVDAAGEVAQAGRVGVRHVNEGRAHQRCGAGQVDVVAQQNRGARRDAAVEAAASVGQHQRGGSGGSERPDAVHDGRDPASLVEVGAPGEDRGDAVARRPNDHDATAMALDRRREEARKRVELAAGERRPDLVDARLPTRSQHQADVDPVDPEALAQSRSGVLCAGGR